MTEWNSYSKFLSFQKYKGLDHFSMAKDFMIGYNRQEAAELFKLSLRDPSLTNDDKAFAYFGIAYCNGADYNMYGDAYNGLRKTKDWPSLNIALKSMTECLLIKNSNKAWSIIYHANLVRFKTKSLMEYVKILDKDLTNHLKDGDANLYAIHAEARMLLEPWKLWDRESMRPTENAKIVFQLLNRGLEIDSNNEWLCHLKIHACEMGPKSEFDMSAVTVLENSINGHLRHMPSHIYIQTGDYVKSADLNKEAVEFDVAARCVKISQFELYSFYECHNLHFVVYASSMCGKKEDSLKYARRLTGFVDARISEEEEIGISTIMCEAFHMIEPMTYIRFGLWDMLIGENTKNHSSMTGSLFYTYARAIAYAAKNLTNEARKEIDSFKMMLEKIDKTRKLHNETVYNIGSLALQILQGEYNYRIGQEWRGFIRNAIKFEEKLAYDEPPSWMIPVRQTFGALLSETRYYDEAMSCFIEDLNRWPNNIWSLAAIERLKKSKGDEMYIDQKRSLEKLRLESDVTVRTSCACASSHWNS